MYTYTIFYANDSKPYIYYFIIAEISGFSFPEILFWRFLFLVFSADFLLELWPTWLQILLFLFK